MSDLSYRSASAEEIRKALDEMLGSDESQPHVQETSRNALWSMYKEALANVKSDPVEDGKAEEPSLDADEIIVTLGEDTDDSLVELTTLVPVSEEQDNLQAEDLPSPAPHLEDNTLTIRQILIDAADVLEELDGSTPEPTKKAINRFLRRGDFSAIEYNLLASWHRNMVARRRQIRYNEGTQGPVIYAAEIALAFYNLEEEQIIDLYPKMINALKLRMESTSAERIAVLKRGSNSKWIHLCQ